MITTVQRNFVKIALPITSLFLFICIVYIWTIEPFPEGLNLCNSLKDTDGRKNVTRQWWEWACLIEREWLKGLEFDCKDLRKMGGYHICYDKPYMPGPNCLVYSFGKISAAVHKLCSTGKGPRCNFEDGEDIVIDNDFDFDDAMAEAGCQVFSFDPSMGVSDHQRSERVHFFNIGLSTVDSDTFVPLMDGYTQHSDKTWKIRTLASLKKMLGHENKTLDVLKMDIETYEWPILKNMLKDGSLKYIKQLPMEWHIFPNEPMRTEFRSMYQTYLDLRKMGLRLFYIKFGALRHSRLFFNLQTDTTFVNTLFQ